MSYSARYGGEQGRKQGAGESRPATAVLGVRAAAVPRPVHTRPCLRVGRITPQTRDPSGTPSPRHTRRDGHRPRRSVADDEKSRRPSLSRNSSPIPCTRRFVSPLRTRSTHSQLLLSLPAAVLAVSVSRKHLAPPCKIFSRTPSSSPRSPSRLASLSATSLRFFCPSLQPQP
jgi:hypothetical protein